MFNIENYKITLKKGKELLKEIEDELPRSNQRQKDSNGNRKYRPNKRLDNKVRQLLINLDLSIYNNTTNRTLQLLTMSSI